MMRTDQRPEWNREDQKVKRGMKWSIAAGGVLRVSWWVKDEGNGSNISILYHFDHMFSHA